jgi:repressor of nif and glnA expression
MLLKKARGKILANFREIPAICKPIAETVIARLNEIGLGGSILMGNTSETICEIHMELNKVGMILYRSLNPAPAAKETGIKAESHAMSTVMDCKGLINYKELLR